MKRRFLAVIILIFFIMSTCAFTFNVDSYSKPIRIGLKNMISTNINVVLNGNCTLNDNILNAGSSFSVSLSGGKVLYNGALYDSLTFIPLSPDITIRLEVGAKKYNYKGTMEFKAVSKGIIPINYIDIEEYLKGVVAFEMSNSYPIEALKAQAIAARNYALSNLGKHKSEGYDLCDTTDCQVYRGFNPAYTNVIRAVEETRGKVLVYGDELVSAYYAASTGGYTEASGNIWKVQLPYLIAKKDDFENENWPFGNMTFASGEIDKILKTKGYIKATDKFEKIDINSISRYESGRVASINIVYLSSNGTENRKSITKDGARTFLSLPSSLFNVVYDAANDIYTFSGKGYGHGVGMSQIGAKNRANAGQTYDTILYFYYDGTSLVDINSNIKNDTGDISQNPTTGGGVIVPPGNTGLPAITPPQTAGNSNVNTTITPSPGVTVPPKTTGSAVVVPPKANGDSTGVKPKPVDSGVVKNSTSNSDNSRGNNIKFTRELKKGMSGADVKSLQEILKGLKYFKEASTTNYFGSVTESSVKAFQKNQSLKQTGIADRITLDTLTNMLLISSVRNNNSKTTAAAVKSSASKAVTATSKPSAATKAKASAKLDVTKSLKKGMKGNEVKSLQTALKSLGYYKDVVNGIFGIGTENAVKVFQKSNKIASIGVAGPLTLSKINEKIVKLGNI